MPIFTIETTFWTPAYRHCSYEAATLEDACRLAIKDDCWDNQKTDYDACGPAYISGAWHGADAAYEGQSLPVPAPFGDTEQRKIDHFEVLLALLKASAAADNKAAQAAIAKAEAIIAGQPDPS